MPALRNAFSEKLRSLVGQEKSIAHVCRELLINRQQFNRYLSGETMPSEQNISKLSGYFGITVNSFFNQAEPAASPLPALSDEPFLRRLSCAFDSETRVLRDGGYFFYLPFPGVEEQCVRSFLVTKTSGARMRFKGCMNLRKLDDPDRSSSWVYFSGMVREKDGAVLFLGSLRDADGDIFTINVTPVFPSRNTKFAGIATSARAAVISARRIAIEYVPKPSSILKLVKMSGMLAVDGPDVSSWVRSAISSDDGGAQSVLQPKSTISIIGN
jgi:transcriptional regulator with XRE-family HTH domain